MIMSALPLLQTGFVLGEQRVEPLVSTDALFFGLKLLFLLAFFLYVIFAFIAARQIQIMRNTIMTSFSSLLQIVGYLHLAFAVGVFLLFLIIL